MINLKYSTLCLFALLLVTACGDSEDEEGSMDLKECQLTDVFARVGETSGFGLMSLEYDTDGNVTVAGLQDHIITYDIDGNVISSLLESSVGVPRVETTFTYDGEMISNARQVWGDDPFADPRYIYDMTYVDGYLDKVTVNGAFSEQILDFDFDSNGNVLRYVEWVFHDVTNYTYDNSQKGLFSEPLAHSRAIAYSISASQPFLFWNNAIATVTEDDETFTFTNMYDDQGLMIEARTEDDEYSYYFEYECK